MPASDNLKPSFIHPAPWLVFLGALAATAWMGWGSPVGIAIACAVSAGAAWAVAGVITMRRHVLRLTDEAHAARAAEARIRCTLDDLPQAVWQCNAHSDRTYVNPAWERLTGQSAEAAANQGWAERVHPDDRDRRQGAHRIAAANGEPYAIDYRLHDAGGEIRWAVDFAAPRFDDDGELIGFTGLSVDVTDRKRTEADLLQRIKDLTNDRATLQEQAVDLADRCEALKASARDDEREGRLRDEFLTALVGEMRGPIEIVHEAVELLHSPDLSEAHVLQLDRLGHASSDLSAVLGRALELASAVDEAPSLDVSQCNLRHVVEEALGPMMKVAADRNVTVACDLAHTLPTRASADGTTLRCGIADLAVAALNLAGDGGLSVRAEGETTAPGESVVRVALAVAGRDVPQESIDRAFQPAESGAGLGLGPCRRMIERLGGETGVSREADGRVVLKLAVPVGDPGPGDDPRRAFPRLAQECIRCNHGPVLDLSASGMRVRFKKPPQGVVDIELGDEDQTIRLKAEVVWSRRIAFRAHEVGLRFVDLQPQTVAQLGRLAARNRIRRVLGAA